MKQELMIENSGHMYKLISIWNVYSVYKFYEYLNFKTSSV